MQRDHLEGTCSPTVGGLHTRVQGQSGGTALWGPGSARQASSGEARASPHPGHWGLVPQPCRGASPIPQYVLGAEPHSPSPFLSPAEPHPVLEAQPCSPASPTPSWGPSPAPVLVPKAKPHPPTLSLGRSPTASWGPSGAAWRGRCLSLTCCSLHLVPLPPHPRTPRGGPSPPWPWHVGSAAGCTQTLFQRPPGLSQQRQGPLTLALMAGRTGGGGPGEAGGGGMLMRGGGFRQKGPQGHLQPPWLPGGGTATYVLSWLVRWWAGPRLPWHLLHWVGQLPTGACRPHPMPCGRSPPSS